jgi:hypothetical protein
LYSKRAHEWEIGLGEELMGFYSEFIQYCRICGQEMQVAVDGGAGLSPGNRREAVCSQACSQEFRQRQDRSASNKPQDLAGQRRWCSNIRLSPEETTTIH